MTAVAETEGGTNAQSRRRRVSKEQKHMRFLHLFPEARVLCVCTCGISRAYTDMRAHTHHTHSTIDEKLPGPYEERKPHTRNLKTMPRISGRALLQTYLLLGPG